MKSKIWNDTFMKALGRMTSAPKSLQQEAVISVHQVLSHHEEAVQLHMHSNSVHLYHRPKCKAQHSDS